MKANGERDNDDAEEAKAKGIPRRSSKEKKTKIAPDRKLQDSEGEDSSSLPCNEQDLKAQQEQGKKKKKRSASASPMNEKNAQQIPMAMYDEEHAPHPLYFLPSSPSRHSSYASAVSYIPSEEQRNERGNDDDDKRHDRTTSARRTRKPHSRSSALQSSSSSVRETQQAPTGRLAPCPPVEGREKGRRRMKRNDAPSPSDTLPSSSVLPSSFVSSSSSLMTSSTTTSLLLPFRSQEEGSRFYHVHYNTAYASTLPLSHEDMLYRVPNEGEESRVDPLRAIREQSIPLKAAQEAQATSSSSPTKEEEKKSKEKRRKKRENIPFPVWSVPSSPPSVSGAEQQPHRPPLEPLQRKKAHHQRVGVRSSSSSSGSSSFFTTSSGLVDVLQLTLSRYTNTSHSDGSTPLLHAKEEEERRRDALPRELHEEDSTSEEEDEDDTEEEEEKEKKMHWEVLEPFFPGFTEHTLSDEERLQELAKRLRTLQEGKGLKENLSSSPTEEVGGRESSSVQTHLLIREDPTPEDDAVQQRKREAVLQDRQVKELKGRLAVPPYRCLERNREEKSRDVFSRRGTLEPWSPLSLPPFPLPPPFFDGLPTSLRPWLSPFSLPVVEAVSLAAMKRDALVQGLEWVHATIVTSPCEPRNGVVARERDPSFNGGTASAVRRTPVRYVPAPTSASSLVGIALPPRPSCRSGRAGEEEGAGEDREGQEKLFGTSPAVFCYDVFPSSPSYFSFSRIVPAPASGIPQFHPGRTSLYGRREERGGVRGWPITVQVYQSPSFSPCRYFLAAGQPAAPPSATPGLLPMLWYDTSSAWSDPQERFTSPPSAAAPGFGKTSAEEGQGKKKESRMEPSPLRVLIPEKFVFSHGNFIRFTAAIMMSRFYRLYQFRTTVLEEERMRDHGAFSPTPSSLLVPPLFMHPGFSPFHGMGKGAGGQEGKEAKRPHAPLAPYQAMRELEKLLQWSIQDAILSRYPFMSEQASSLDGLAAPSTKQQDANQRGDRWGDERGDVWVNMGSKMIALQESLATQLYDCDNMQCLPNRYLRGRTAGTFQDHVKRCMEDGVVPPSPMELLRRQHLQEGGREEEMEEDEVVEIEEEIRRRKQRREAPVQTPGFLGHYLPRIPVPFSTVPKTWPDDDDELEDVVRTQKKRVCWRRRRGGARVTHWKWWTMRCPLFLGCVPPFPVGCGSVEDGGEPFLFTSFETTKHKRMLEEEAFSLAYAYYHAAQQYDCAGGEGSMVYSVLNGLLPEMALYDVLLMLQKLRLALQFSYRHPLVRDGGLRSSTTPAITLRKNTVVEPAKENRISRSSAVDARAPPATTPSAPPFTALPSTDQMATMVEDIDHRETRSTSSPPAMMWESRGRSCHDDVKLEKPSPPPQCARRTEHTTSTMLSCTPTLYSVAVMLGEFFPGRDHHEWELLCRAVVQDCLALRTLRSGEEERLTGSGTDAGEQTDGTPIGKTATGARGEPSLPQGEMKFLYEVANAMMVVVMEHDAARRSRSMRTTTPTRTVNTFLSPPPPPMRLDEKAMARLKSTVVPVPDLFGYHEAFFDPITQTWLRSHLVETARALYAAGLYQYIADMQTAILRAGFMEYHEIFPCFLAVEPRIGKKAECSSSTEESGSKPEMFSTLGISSPVRSMLRLRRLEGNLSIPTTGVGSVQAVVEAIQEEDPLKPLDDVEEYVFHLLVLYFQDFEFPSEHPFFHPPVPSTKAELLPPSTSLPAPSPTSPPQPLPTDLDLLLHPVSSASPPIPLFYPAPPKTLEDILLLNWFSGPPGQRLADTVYVDLYALATYCPLVFARRLVYYKDNENTPNGKF